MIATIIHVASEKYKQVVAMHVMMGNVLRLFNIKSTNRFDNRINLLFFCTTINFPVSVFVRMFLLKLLFVLTQFAALKS